MRYMFRRASPADEVKEHIESIIMYTHIFTLSNGTFDLRGEEKWLWARPPPKTKRQQGDEETNVCDDYTSEALQPH